MRTFAYGQRRYFIAPLLLIVFAVFSTLIMLLWNALMTVLFNLPIIGFWQAAGLLVLSRLLFGIGRSHGPWTHHTWKANLREKISNMTPEERKEFMGKLHTRYHSWYHESSEQTESGTKSQTE